VYYAVSRHAISLTTGSRVCAIRDSFVGAIGPSARSSPHFGRRSRESRRKYNSLLAEERLQDVVGLQFVRFGSPGGACSSGEADSATVTQLLFRVLVPSAITMLR
jgi:hypothetical protein